jgi:protein-disulfide isomerase
MNLRNIILVAATLVGACDKGQAPSPAPAAQQKVEPAAVGTATDPAKPAEAAPEAGKPAQPPARTAERTPPPKYTPEQEQAAIAVAKKMPLPETGGKEPKVEVIEFSDFQCPFCSRVVPTLKQIKETYKDDVRVKFLHNPLSFHKDAKPAAIAAAAAQKQGKFWEMHDKLFENQRQLQPADLERYAGELGLDVAQFKKDADELALSKFVDRNQAVSFALKATGTPAFFINGKALKGAQPFPGFQALIDEEIKAATDAGKQGDAWIQERTRTNSAELVGFLYEGKEPPAVPAQNAPDAARQPPVDRSVYKVTVRPNDPMKGNKNALVTLVEFSEFQCPFCSRINPTMKQIADAYGDKVRFVFKHNPLPFHKDAFPASETSLCAHEQGKFWEMHDKLFENQRALTAPDLEKYATEVGLDMAKYKKCAESHKFKTQIDEDMELATKVTARGTPNVFVNGRKLTGAKPFEEFKEVIDEELKKAEALVQRGIAPEGVYEEIVKRGKIFEPLEEQVFELDLSKAAVVGNRDAKVKIVEFSDFQCPFCSRVSAPMKEVQKHYGDKAAVFFLHFPLSFHQQAFPAAEAAECGAKQGKFWEMHDALFGAQKDLAVEGKLVELAKSIGLKEADFKKCLDEHEFKARVEADMEQGRKAQVRGTPSIYINGRKFSSPGGYNPEAFIKVIDQYILGAGATPGAAPKAAAPPAPAPR